MPPIFDTAYWCALVVASTAAFAVTLLVATGRLQGRRGAWAMLACIAALVVAGRWPAVLIPGPLNPDESMMLAQAMKFGTDLVPWRAIDPGTGGPVNSYVLLLGHWLGLDFGYPLARVMAIACVCTALGLGFLALRRIGGAAAAAIAILPATMFLATASDDDFLHYSSELASLAAIALLTFLASGFRGCGPTWRHNLARGMGVGACAFLVAMSKVQGVPLGATVALCTIALTAESVTVFARRVVLVAAGGLAAVLMLLGVLAASGVLSDFKASFIDLPATYASHPLSYARTKAFVFDIPESRSFVQAIGWLFALALIAQVVWVRGVRAGTGLVRAAALVLVAAATYFTLSQPGREFPHYLNYLSLGATWLLFLVLPWPLTQPAEHGKGVGMAHAP